MTWDPTQPIASQSPSLFPAKAQDNWDVLYSNISEDHNFVTTLPGTNPGYHKIVHWVNQGTTDPSATGGIAKSYTKTVTVKRDSSNVTTEHLFTMPGSNNAGNITNPLSVCTIKACARFEFVDATNTPQTIISSYNIDSIRTSSSTVQEFVITLSFSFPGLGYLVIPAITSSSTTAVLSICEKFNARTVNSFRLIANSSSTDPSYIDFIVLGV